MALDASILMKSDLITSVVRYISNHMIGTLAHADSHDNVLIDDLTPYMYGSKYGGIQYYSYHDSHDVAKTMLGYK